MRLRLDRIVVPALARRWRVEVSWVTKWTAGYQTLAAVRPDMLTLRGHPQYM